MIAQDARQQIDVSQIRYVLERQPVWRQQRSDQQRQGRVLGPGDGNFPVELVSARDLDSIHSAPLP